MKKNHKARLALREASYKLSQEIWDGKWSHVPELGRLPIGQWIELPRELQRRCPGHSYEEYQGALSRSLFSLTFLRFHLRTLMIGMAVAPPAIAALWLWRSDIMFVLGLFFLTLTFACAIWLTLAVPLAIGWILDRSVKWMIRALASSKNCS